MSDENYTNVLLEEMNGKFDRLIEAMAGVKDEVSLSAKQVDLDEVKTDLKIVKAAVTDTNVQVQNLEQRVTNIITA